MKYMFLVFILFLNKTRGKYNRALKKTLTL